MAHGSNYNVFCRVIELYTGGSLDSHFEFRFVTFDSGHVQLAWWWNLQNLEVWRMIAGWLEVCPLEVDRNEMLDKQLAVHRSNRAILSTRCS